MNEVTDALSPVEDGQRAENCFLFGPSGAGKTTVAKAAVRELRREGRDAQPLLRPRLPFPPVRLARKLRRHLLQQHRRQRRADVPGDDLLV